MLLIYSVILTLIYGVLHQAVGDPTTCDVSRGDRFECGGFGLTIGMDTCRAKHCCYDHLIFSFNCFMPKDQCSTLQSERVECGYPGIQRADCLARNCCFEGTNTGIYCFQRTNACAVDTWNRYSCGHHGIEQRECETMNCCFDKNTGECFQRFLSDFYEAGGARETLCTPPEN